jgi:hypothetical protein
MTSLGEMKTSARFKGRATRISVAVFMDGYLHFYWYKRSGKIPSSLNG